MEKRDNDSKKVRKSDIEFVSYMANLEDEKEHETDNFVFPSCIFKMYIETTTKADYEEEMYDHEDADDLNEDSLAEIEYIVYGVIEGMYFHLRRFDSREMAERFASTYSIKLEKTLKKKLLDSFMHGLNGGLT